MKILVLASRKGGAGKTTLAAHLAVEAERQGAGPVTVIDADPMSGGLAGWWNARKAEQPALVEVGQGGLRSTITALRKGGVRLVVIDTPPAASESIAAIVEEADLVVIPVIPSPQDLLAIGETIEMVEGAGRPMMFVLNNAGAGKLTGQAAVALSQHGTVAAVDGEPVIVRYRQDYRSSMIDGRTAPELRASSKSTLEIGQLWQAVEARLRKGERRGKSVAA